MGTTSNTRNIRLLFLGLSLAVAALGCGSDEEYKDKQAEEFYAEKLNIEKQESCNANGMFWDNYTQPESCSSLSLADWSCSEAGFEERISTLAGHSDVKNNLRSYGNLGFELHQCGEGAESIKVVLAKKSRNDTQAAISIFTVEYFIHNNLLISMTRPTSDNNVVSLDLFGDSMIVTEGKYSEDCNRYAFQYLRTASGACEQVSVAVDYDYSAGDTWTITGESSGELMTLKETDFDGQMLDGDNTIYCSEYAGTIYGKDGDRAGYRFVALTSAKVASHDELLASDIMGLAFQDQDSCESLNANAAE